MTTTNTIWMYKSQISSVISTVTSTTQTATSTATIIAQYLTSIPQTLALVQTNSVNRITSTLPIFPSTLTTLQILIATTIESQSSLKMSSTFEFTSTNIGTQIVKTQMTANRSVPMQTKSNIDTWSINQISGTSTNALQSILPSFSNLPETGSVMSSSTTSAFSNQSTTSINTLNIELGAIFGAIGVLLSILIIYWTRRYTKRQKNIEKLKNVFFINVDMETRETNSSLICVQLI